MMKLKLIWNILRNNPVIANVTFNTGFTVGSNNDNIIITNCHIQNTSAKISIKSDYANAK